MSTQPGIFPRFMFYDWCSQNTGKIFHIEIHRRERVKQELSVLKAFAKVLDQYPSHKIRTLNQHKLNKKSAIMCVHII